MPKKHPQLIPSPWLTQQDLTGPNDVFIPLSLETKEIEVELSLELSHRPTLIPEEIG